jgi:hypothetical protein
MAEHEGSNMVICIFLQLTPRTLSALTVVALSWPVGALGGWSFSAFLQLCLSRGIPTPFVCGHARVLRLEGGFTAVHHHKGKGPLTAAGHIW